MPASRHWVWTCGLRTARTGGRLDLAVLLDARVYLFEFKVAERASEGAALAQLLDRRYADKYRGLNAPIHLIGVEFSQATRGSHRLRRGGRLIRVHAASSRRAIPGASPVSVPTGLHHGLLDGVGWYSSTRRLDIQCAIFQRFRR